MMIAIQENRLSFENVGMTESEKSQPKEELQQNSAPVTMDLPTEPAAPNASTSTASPSTASDPPDPTPHISSTATIPMDTWMGLDPKYAILERIQWWIVTGVVVVLCLVGWMIYCFATWNRIGITHGLLLAGVGLLALAGYVCSQHFPQRILATSSWQITESGIEIRRGIWWRHRIFVPHDRIQHTDVNQGPLARWFDIATLVINTGGTHQPSIPLEGLNHQQAEQLRKQLTHLSRPTSHVKRS